jgi:hypothetical protein
MKPFNRTEAEAVLRDHYHIPAAGQTEQQFKDEELSKDPGLTLEKWSLSVPLLVETGAMTIDRIAGWSIQAQVEAWLAEMKAVKDAQAEEARAAAELAARQADEAAAAALIVATAVPAPAPSDEQRPDVSVSRTPEGRLVIEISLEKLAELGLTMKETA